MKYLNAVLILLSVVVLATDLFSQIATYEGNGDDVITIKKPEKGQPYLLSILGNSERRHFSITGYTTDSNYTDLLVNTSDFYSGIVGVDLGSGEDTEILEIKAEGQWKIGVWHIGSAQKIVSSKRSDGANVLWVVGNPFTAKISANAGRNNFAVTAYDKNGDYAKLLVNTTDRYNGTVLLPKEVWLLEIKAVGDWTIELQFGKRD
jgi:hypothetical protein